MTTPPTVRTWDSREAAELWRKSAGRRAQALGAATEQMLVAARLGPGMHVLDVAAGTGDQTLLAAQRVGPSGSVLATDIAQSMLDVALEAAREAGLTNVAVQAADASALDPGGRRFDAAICRFGLMFVPDVDAALARIAAALKPGARFATLVWDTEALNPYVSLQIGLVREMGRMPDPPPSLARTTSLSAPGLLAGLFERAGFTDVSTQAVETPRVFASVDDAFEAMQSSSPARGELGRLMSDDEREHYGNELRRRLAEYVQPDGRVLLRGSSLLVAGAAPASPRSA